MDKKYVLIIICVSAIFLLIGIFYISIRNKRYNQSHKETVKSNAIPNESNIYNKIQSMDSIETDQYSVEERHYSYNDFMMEFNKIYSNKRYKLKSTHQKIQSELNKLIKDFVEKYKKINPKNHNKEERIELICSYFSDYIDREPKNNLEKDLSDILIELNAEELLNYYFSEESKLI